MIIRRFYFDFSTTYVGVGMICPHIINVSLLVGGILSWGLMWPLIGDRKGDWYPADLSSDSFSGLQGYKVNSHSEINTSFMEAFRFIENLIYTLYSGIYCHSLDPRRWSV